MTARAIVMTLALTLGVVGCSPELPLPEVASAVPAPTGTLVEGIAPSPPDPCPQWKWGYANVEWQLDRCDRPRIPTTPPPTPLAHDPWSRRAELLDAEDAPWKRDPDRGVLDREPSPRGDLLRRPPALSTSSDADHASGPSHRSSDASST